MKARHKTYLKLNIMSLVFIVVSFMSVTLAWFAYSGLADVTTEVGVKAWYVELSKDGEVVSNDIAISLDDIYPGMTTITEKVKIENKGDSAAQVKYQITQARLLDIDNYITNLEITSPFVEDKLSHDYLFHVNINLSKGYIIEGGGESTFEVSISWPLDSDTDTLDSYWGTEAYEFQKSEEDKLALDANYQIRPAIQIVIGVTAEQYMEEEDTSDPLYNLGDAILFDVINNTSCTVESSTCLNTRVIDVDSKLGDTTVTLLPDVSKTYLTGSFSNYNSLFSTFTSGWTVTTRSLQVNDLLKIVSTDIINSLLIRSNLSDMVIGKLGYGSRMMVELNRAITYNGYYKFLNDKFAFLVKDSCYWTSSEYNTNNAFAVSKIDELNSKIYPLSKTSTCSIIPVIIVDKSRI